MARPLTEIVHEIYARYEASGAQYSTKQIIKNTDAIQRLRKRNLAIWQYLQAGMSVAAAIEAWKNDQ